MNRMRVLLAVTMTAAVMLGTAGCKEEGAGEKAGKAADEAISDIGDTLKGAADEMNDAGKDAAKDVKDAVNK
jgi:hypothetical protein